MKTTLDLLGPTLLSLAMLACVGDATPAPQDDADDDGVPDGPASGGDDNTFDHPEVIPDVWDLLDRLSQEGPPEFSARVHSCPKMKYQTIGNVLASRGVDLGGGGDTSAGQMWRDSSQALGAANYAARVPERTELTTASAAKLYDIWSQAAQQIIDQMPGRAECTVGGVGARMFNELDQCTADGISCLLGVPATAGHVELCNEMVERATTPATGKIIAVAALAAAAHTCE
jgi:hypothetical protein